MVSLGAPPRGASSRGRPFSRARVYFVGIAKISDYSQSRDRTMQEDNGLTQHEDCCIIVYLPVFAAFICDILRINT